jgi:hypothetical protein
MQARSTTSCTPTSRGRSAVKTTNLADLYKLAPLDWDDVRGTLETNLTQEPGTGGPGHHTFWLSTLDADGGRRRLHP